MKVLTVKPHWAWLICNTGANGKNCENRSQRTNHRGPLLIQASKTPPSKREYAECEEFAFKRGIRLPPLAELQCGGIVGVCEVTGCSKESDSAWHEPGYWGWRLEKRMALPFVPIAGRLGIFDAPKDMLEQLLAAADSQDERKRISRLFGWEGDIDLLLDLQKRVKALPPRIVTVTNPGGDDQLRFRYVNGE